MTANLEGKIAVVTGAGSGLGRASTVALARAGASVVVSDVNDDGGAETVALVVENGGTAVYVHADVSVASECEQLIAAAVEAYGSVHVLHNNAGIALPMAGRLRARCRPRALGPGDRHQPVERLLLLPLRGAGHGGRGRWCDRQHRIVDGAPAARWARRLRRVEGRRRVAHPIDGAELRPLGIRVNAISPGYVDTPMNAMIWGSDELRAGFERGHANGPADRGGDRRPGRVPGVRRRSQPHRGGNDCDRGWTAFKSPDILRGG